MVMLIKKTKNEIIFDIFNKILLVIFCAAMIYPILYVISRSFMTDLDRSIRPLSLIPHQWTFEGYTFLFSAGSLLLNSYKITFFRTIVGTVISIVLECMFAYVISKKNYPLRNFLTMMVAFTMWFGGGLIPSFLLNKYLGFINSIWVYVIPGAMSVWYILILRNFFSQIPESIEESGKIDGANEAVILFKLILPLSTAVIATISLFHIVGHWNDWFTGILYVNDRNKQPAMVILRQVLYMSTARELRSTTVGGKLPPTEPVKMATIVVVALPIVVAYPFFQKHFVKGMLIGSIKG